MLRARPIPAQLIATLRECRSSGQPYFLKFALKKSLKTLFGDASLRTKGTEMKVVINTLENEEGWRSRVAENLKNGNDVTLENFNHDLHWEACDTLAFVHGVSALLNERKDECHFKRANAE